MARFAHFSKHALKRISQRTALNFFSIADILDCGLAVDVGKELVFDKRHWLFYSDVDSCCFVAVQDALSGLVITVLPLDYHENLAWKISDEAIVEAKRKSSSYVPVVKDVSKEHPSIIIVKARYMADEGFSKTSTLAKFRSSDYKDDLFNVLRDKSFESEVNYHCKRKGINPSRVYEIAIALGNGGEPLIIEWNSNVDG